MSGAPEKRLRLLMVTPRFPPEVGGIETHVHEVSRRLAASGHFVEILTTDRTRSLPPVEIVSSGLRVRRVPAWPRGRDYYVAPRLVRAIAETSCDLVHVQGCHTFVAPLAMFAALRQRRPYIITFHSGGHSSGFRNLLRTPQWRTLRPLVRRAHHCIGVSRYEADFFSAVMGVPRERFSVIPNGGELPAAIMPDSAEGGPLIVSIGRLERYKGHHRLIEALPLLLRHVPDARIRILGEGPYRPKLEALTRRLGLEQQVSIGGFPPAERARLAGVLASAAVVTLLSDYEAHPVAVMEALALGRRVLVTACTGFSEMIDGDAVAAIQPEAGPSEIASALLERLGKGTLPSPIALPTWDDCAARLAAQYRGVLQ
jgi:glycosyltransferase involved in cell wall biosynthesis